MRRHLEMVQHLRMQQMLSNLHLPCYKHLASAADLCLRIKQCSSTYKGSGVCFGAWKGAVTKY